MGHTWEDSLCKGPEAEKSLKYPQNRKKGSETLEVMGGRAGVGIQVPQPAFLSIPVISTANAFLVPKYVAHMPEVVETKAGINFHVTTVVET